MKNWHVYLITSQELSRGRSTLQVVKEAVAAGVDVVQLREKTMEGKELLEIGKKIREITKAAGVKYIVNDRVDIALLTDADGVHLGQSDIPYKHARTLVGENMIIGISVDTVKQAVKAEREGADYIGVGPVYATNSKNDAGPCLGLENLKKIRSNSTIPIVAVGGINHENAKEVILNGADCLSVISAITQAEDIQGSVQELKRQIISGKGELNK
ncbi:MAG: thiamine phosphate synthase [Clostridia bacterium]|nr:thiamine phosphate synthase [Clostridia bacterium]